MNLSSFKLPQRFDSSQACRDELITPSDGKEPVALSCTLAASCGVRLCVTLPPSSRDGHRLHHAMHPQFSVDAFGVIANGMRTDIKQVGWVSIAVEDSIQQSLSTRIEELLIYNSLEPKQHLNESVLTYTGGLL